MENSLKWTSAISIGFSILMLAGCASTPPASSTTMGSVSQRPFGHTADGKAVDLYTLRNASGAEASICTYGGTVVSLKVPDRSGQLGDVVLGYDTLDGYLTNSPFFGALIGRYGNRIAKGKFTLEGKDYTVTTNDGPNTLHGGAKGFDKVLWQGRSFVTSAGPALELRYRDRDGEEGFPGNLNVTAVYTLTQDNGLKVEFTAATDKDTVFNPTHHSYFNLAGKGDILNHQVMIPADAITPVDSTLIPTGKLQPVAGTPFDFRTPTAIGARINQDDEQLKFGKGYDHNWVINKPLGQLGLVARVTESTSGRVMEVLSTEPGLQFYTGNFLNGSIKGKGGWAYELRNGFCMEPQHYPDSPNEPSFPTTELKPGDTFKSTILYRFSVQK